MCWCGTCEFNSDKSGWLINGNNTVGNELHTKKQLETKEECSVHLHFSFCGYFKGHKRNKKISQLGDCDNKEKLEPVKGVGGAIPV